MIKDWRGRPIEPGTLIVYPVRFSSSMHLVEARVLRIETRFDYGRARPRLVVERLRESLYYSIGAESASPRTVNIDSVDRVTVVV